MATGELRGADKPNLDQALGWIGSRVDDIYGASVGRLEDVWVDPGTGAPMWLLIKEGRFGGRTTLIPFEDATAGAGHVWIPYERDVVRDAPEVQHGTTLTQELEAELRRHYGSQGSRSAAEAEIRQEAGVAADPEPVVAGSVTKLYPAEDPTGESSGQAAAQAPAAPAPVASAAEESRKSATPPPPVPHWQRKPAVAGESATGTPGPPPAVVEPPAAIRAAATDEPDPPSETAATDVPEPPSEPETAATEPMEASGSAGGEEKPGGPAPSQALDWHVEGPVEIELSLGDVRITGRASDVKIRPARD